jgi:transcription elongation factor Elf1
MIPELKYSRGSGKFQCPGCYKWFEFEYFIEHHIQYEPVEIKRYLCRKCHSGIHKTGIPSGRKEYLEKLNERREITKLHKDHTLYTFNCDFCGKEYTVNRSKMERISNQKHHFCCDACRLNALREHRSFPVWKPWEARVHEYRHKQHGRGTWGVKP